MGVRRTNRLPINDITESGEACGKRRQTTSGPPEIPAGRVTGEQSSNSGQSVLTQSLNAAVCSSGAVGAGPRSAPGCQS